MTRPRDLERAPAQQTGRFESVIDRWLASADPRGDHAALRDLSTVVSHSDLVDVARARAGELRARGLRADDRVVVMLTSSVEQAAWIAAVMLAGGCAVPLGLNQPDQRARTLIGLAAPWAVIADASTSHLADGQVCIDGSIQGADRPTRLPRPGPDWAAYICFTSGTTGGPKGVVVTHEALAHTTAAMAAHLALAQRPRTHVLATSWSFDVAMMDLWLALTSGGTLFMPGRPALLGPALPVTLSGVESPILHTVPSLLGGSSVSDLRSLPEGTTVMVGGESVAAALLAELAHGTDLHVVYGITETAIITTASAAWPSITPDVIGRPLPGTECVVTDASGRPVADGNIGELQIGGPVVARGYLGNPAATAARFLAADGGARRYRSGDLVRRHPDGSLTFHGRADQQLKILGHRVEPAEVEQALLAIPGVRQAAVVARDDPSGELALVAYLAGDGIEVTAVRKAARANMAEWMCPRSVQVLPALPTGVTGKIDRSALPDPTWPAEQPTHPVDDATNTETAIGILWQQLLGGEQPVPGANFVELGGHSLKAAQLSTALRDEFGVLVSVPDVLGLPTMRELARLVDQLRDAGAASAPASALAPATAQGGRRPVHGAVRQIWLHQELAGDAGLYNLVVTVRLGGPLQVTALQRALQLIERRHAALRTSFDFRDDEVIAIEHPPADRPLVIRAAEESEAISRAGARAIDLSGRPWNYQLIKAEPGRSVLLLTFHHAAVDGVAIVWLLKQLAEAYSAIACPSAYLAPMPGEVPMPTVPEETDASWWAARMRDAPPPVALPAQRISDDLPEFSGWCRPTELAGVRAGLLRQAAAARGATLHAAMLSVFVRTIARTVGTSDVIVGVAISRRDVHVDHSAIGQFVSVLPVRFELPGHLGATGCLDAVVRTMRDVMRHGAVDPAEVIAAARAARPYSAGDVFRLGFSWEDDLPELEFAGLESSWAIEFNGWSDSELTFELAARGDRIAGRVIGRESAATVDIDAFMASMSGNATELAAALEDRSGP